MSLPQEARQPTEGGLRNHRCEFVRETEQGVPPSDPAWMLFSDTMQSIFNWAPDTNMEAQRGVSDVDANDHFPGPESHEASFEYDMQHWFVDGEGNPLGAAYDGLFRDENGFLPNTHTVVDREWHSQGGADGAGFYLYTVGTGGHVSTVENEGDASTGQPIPLTTEYTFERVRSYAIHQPSAESALVVTSTSDDDTTQQVTIEDEGGGTSEQVALDGTNAVAVTGPFASIDAIRLDGDTIGDVEVAINTADAQAPAAGTVLATIHGREHYSPEGSAHLEGDRGVPTLGAGSHAGTIGTGYEFFIGDRLVRPDGHAGIGPRVNSSSFSVDNNIETNEDASSRVMAIDAGIRDATVEASVAGPKATHDAAADHLAATKGDLTWTFTSGSLVWPNAVVTEPGEKSIESEQSSLYVDDTFEGEAIELGA